MEKFIAYFMSNYSLISPASEMLENALFYFAFFSDIVALFYCIKAYFRTEKNQHMVKKWTKLGAIWLVASILGFISLISLNVVQYNADEGIPYTAEMLEQDMNKLNLSEKEKQEVRSFIEKIPSSEKGVHYIKEIKIHINTEKLEEYSNELKQSQAKLFN